MESNLVSMAQQFSGLPMDALIGGPLNAAANANAKMAMTQTKFMLDTCFAEVPVKEKAAVKGVAAEYNAEGSLIKPAVVGTPAIPAHTSYVPIMVKMELSRAVLTPGVPAVQARAAVGKEGEPGYIPAQAAAAAIPPQINNFTTAFNLPLLTIVPLNSLAVETVDISFEMEVNSSFSDEQTDTSEKQVKAAASFEAKIGFGMFSATIKGSASYDQKDSSTHSTHYQKSNSAKYTVNVHAGQLPLPKGVNIIIEAFANAIQPIELGSSVQGSGSQ